MKILRGKNKKEGSEKETVKKHEHIEFDAFEKLDQKIEDTINEYAGMSEKQRAYKAMHNSFAEAFICALVLNLIVETLGRFSITSLLGGIQFVFQNPLVFLYNTMIIFATLVVASLFKR